MANETTQNPVFNQQRQMDGRVQSAPMNNQQSQQAQQFNMPGSVVCQQCGTTNTLGTLYCVSCGSALHSGSCPHCGSPLDDDADYCEVCHHYVRQDVCSFCGARFAPQDAFCPECGSQLFLGFIIIEGNFCGHMPSNSVYILIEQPIFLWQTEEELRCALLENTHFSS